MRADEEQLGCHRFETYKKFAGRVGEIERDLMAILRDYAARGKKVHAFGAPAKGATLLQLISHHNRPRAMRGGGQPAQDRQIRPGCRLPIVDETKTAPPDAYLLLRGIS